MSVRPYRQRVRRLEAQHQPAAMTPTLAAILGDGERIALVGSAWIAWDQPLPPACKVYGFDPRVPLAEGP